MQVDWKRFKEVIQDANNVILTSHIRPDCDALGSCLGMAGLLESLGKKALSIRTNGLSASAKTSKPTNWPMLTCT